MAVLHPLRFSDWYLEVMLPPRPPFSQPKFLAVASEVPGMFAGTGGRPASKECLFFENVHTVLSAVGDRKGVTSKALPEACRHVVGAPAYQELSV